MVEQGLRLQARQHGDLNRRLGMTNRLWGAVKVAAPVLLGLSVLAPSPLRAGERVCNGTLLQIQVNERGTSRSDRFRFSLGLDAEDLSKDAALSALNTRLAEARQGFSRSPWVSSPSLHPAATPLGEVRLDHDWSGQAPPSQAR